jgi:hypothetical protein
MGAEKVIMYIMGIVGFSGMVALMLFTAWVISNLRDR